MATFLGVHDMGTAITKEKMAVSWEAYKAACAAAGCIPKHAHYNAQQGKAYCVTDANSAADVQKAHDVAKGASERNLRNSRS